MRGSRPRRACELVAREVRAPAPPPRPDALVVVGPAGGNVGAGLECAATNEQERACPLARQALLDCAPSSVTRKATQSCRIMIDPSSICRKLLCFLWHGRFQRAPRAPTARVGSAARKKLVAGPPLVLTRRWGREARRTARQEQRRRHDELKRSVELLRIAAAAVGAPLRFIERRYTGRPLNSQ